VVVAGVVVASALCVIAVSIAVGWVRRRSVNSRAGEGRRSV
jgi:hypothetical protein